MTEPTGHSVVEADPRISPQPESQRSQSSLPSEPSTSEETLPTVIEVQTAPKPEASAPDAQTLVDNVSALCCHRSSCTQPLIVVVQYIKALKDRIRALNGDNAEADAECKHLEQIYDKLKTKNETFLKSKQFLKLMQLATREAVAAADSERLIVQHNDLLVELHRLTLQNEKGNAQKKVKNKRKKIEKLTNTLKRLQKEIYKAEHEELDYTALDSKNGWTDLPKLYRKAEEVWNRREELLKRSTYCGRLIYKRYYCELTTYPDINQCVEQLFNSYLKRLKNRKSKGYVDESFTFIDVRKAILDEISEKNLIISNAEDMITKIYEELIKELKNRREKDSEECIKSLEILDDLKPESFVKEDPQMEIALASNKCRFQSKLDELCEKYATEDRQKNGETLLQEGLSEWESGPFEDNEEFESLDIKEGDLEDEEKDDSQSDEETVLEATPLPDFTLSTPISSQPSAESNEVTPKTDENLTSQTTATPSESTYSPMKSTTSSVRRPSQSSSLVTSPTITPLSTPPGSPTPSASRVLTPGRDLNLAESESDVIDLSDSDDEPDSTTPDANQNKANNESIEVIDLLDTELDLEVDSDDEDQVNSIEDFFTIDKNPMGLSVDLSPLKRRATSTNGESPVPHKCKPKEVAEEVANGGGDSDTNLLSPKKSLNDRSVEIIEID